MLVQHSEENSLKRHQDSSVVQVSDSIKYKQPKKNKAFVSMLISGASYIYIYIYIYIGFIDSCMLCTIINKERHFISEKLIII